MTQHTIRRRLHRLAGAFLAALLLLALPPPALARGHHSHRSSGEYSYRAHPYRPHAHSRIHRSEEAKHAFESMTGYSHGRPGYVVDHVIPLACGGADSPSNMQWQTIAAADKWERKGCHK